MTAKTILLVEDEALIALNEKDFLANAGFDVLTAHNAQKAIDAVRENHIDLILMDIDLGKGKMDGTEAAARILEEIEVPIVFLSSHSEPEFVRKTENITSYGYIQKNTDKAVMLASIRMAFRLFDAHRRVKKEKQERNFQAQILHCVDQAVIATDLTGTITYWNKGAEDLYGWSEEEVLGRNISEITVPDISQEQSQEIMRNLSAGEKWNGEFIVQDKTGRKFYAHVTNSPVFDKNHELVGIVGISYDISKRKKTEEERNRLVYDLGERAKEFRCLAEFSDLVEKNSDIDIIMQGLVELLPPAWQYPDITCARILYRDTAYYTQHFEETPWKQSAELIVQGQTVGSIDVFYLEERPLSYEGPFLHEERILLEMLAERLGRIIERLQAEETITEKETIIRKKEERFRAIVEHMPVLMDAFDEHNNIVFWNRECERVTGYSSAEMVHNPRAMEILYPDTAYRDQVYRELAERGSNFRNVETEITCRDGGKKTISWSNLADIVPIEGWYTWAVGVDVTEQKKAEQKLREREELHRITWQSIGDAVISTDINGNIIDMNSVAEKLTGYELSEARERPLHEVFTIVHNITGEPVENPIAEVISTGEVVALSNHTKLISAGGDVYHIADSAAPIRDDKGENRGVVLVFRDETESYLQRQRLRESEETFRRLFESMAQGVVYHDREGTIISANRAAQRILGLTCEQIMGRTSVDPRWKAIREDGSEFPGEMHPAMVAIETGKPVERKIMGIYRPESDRYVWISVSAVPEFRPGEKEPYRAFATFEDITERRRIRENIQNLLHEKEMLLKEVHHRVKNNMNIIASLLSLQSQMVENPDGAAALVDARDRIFSMQRLYERLYQSGSYTEIDLGEYLDDIIQEIVKTYENERITIFSRVDYFPVGVKTAVPVGIILNELVTNAIKHAFPDGRKGSIEISLIKKDNKGKAELSVIDDGIGLPEDFGFESSDSYGITVLKALVDQLEGTVEQVEAEGTGFLVTFFAGTSGGE